MSDIRDTETADGRRPRVEVAGDCALAICQVGAQEATPIYDRCVKDATARSLTLIAYDRPGYGRSSPQRTRSVVDCAADVRAISRSIGFGRFVVWGLSGGGPRALACAARLDDLVAAVATIASWAPFDAPGLDYFAGVPDAARDDYELLVSDREACKRTDPVAEG
jgi:pimeloyl-ACP methyl ester carboxylesterase